MILKPTSPFTRDQGLCQFGVGVHEDEDERRSGGDEDSEDEVAVAASQEHLQGVPDPGAPLSCQYPVRVIVVPSGLSCPQESYEFVRQTDAFGMSEHNGTIPHSAYAVVFRQGASIMGGRACVTA